MKTWYNVESHVLQELQNIGKMQINMQAVDFVQLHH